jgi:hypothetical protein
VYIRTQRYICHGHQRNTSFEGGKTEMAENEPNRVLSPFHRSSGHPYLHSDLQYKDGGGNILAREDGLTRDEAELLAAKRNIELDPRIMDKGLWVDNISGLSGLNAPPRRKSPY